MNDSSLNLSTPRWLHYWAIATCCATLGLLLLGAEVTTKQVGMVDPVGFRAPWHMATVASLWDRGLGFIIEHSHRLAGFIVGTCIIVLAVGLWRTKLRWLGLAALAGVIVQGLLGGFRVQLNALAGRDLALIHGCFAQVVFALLASLAWLTARGAAVPSSAPADVMTRLRQASLLTAGLVYVQIVFGAMVRHTESPLGPRGHLLGACVLVAVVAWLVRLVLDGRPGTRPLTRTVAVLAGLIGLQVVLGVEAWMARFATAAWPQLQPVLIQPQLLRSVHYLVGALVFAAAVVLALQVQRGQPRALELVAAPARRLEGAA